MSNWDPMAVFKRRRTQVGRRRVRFGALASLIAVVACSPDQTTAPTPKVRRLPAAVTDLTPSATEQLLYQQSPLVGPSHTLGPPVGTEVAADFTVPAGTRWHITRVVSLAASFDGTFNLKVYSDNGGFPSTTVLASASPTLSSSTAPLNPCCGASIYDYSVPVTVTVDPGRYWMSVQGSGLFPQVAPTAGLPMLLGPTLGAWLTVPGLDDLNDIAFSIYGTVESVSESLAGLQTTLDGFSLDAGILKSFLAKLNGATDALNAGDKATACKLLQDLINAVSAQSSKKLTSTQASTVVEEVRRIRGLIGC